MRYAFLVAWREFAENAKTKGFWIGILIFPILIYVSFSAEKLIEKTKSVRHFVLVDASGELETAIEGALERLYQREVLEEFGSWVRDHTEAGAMKVSAEQLEKMPAGSGEAMLARLGGDNADFLDEFLEGGGLEAALAKLRPKLRPDAGDFTPPRRSFKRVELPDGIDPELEPAELAEALRPYLRHERSVATGEGTADLFAAVLVPSDILERIVRPGAGLGLALPGSEKSGIQYWSSNLADDDLRDEIERAINEEVRKREYVARGLDADKVRLVQKTHLPFAALNPKKAAGEEAVSVADKIRQFAPIAFVYLLWIAIFTVAQMLLNNTIEEKSNRIIEVLLSSVTPGELMMGKLAGIAAVGLTMIGTWVLSLVLILQFKAGQGAGLAGEMLKILKGSDLLTYFLVYFVLGYLLYAGAFLAIGSLCNTLKEAQNMMGPIMVIMIVPLMTMMFIPKEPNGTLATVLSWIPIYTPFVMMNRAAADPPLFDRVGTMVLLIATTGAVLWLSGRIFRIGILRTGQPPKLMELLRWVRGG
ncbi:MAG TPA: ABC transporter permease [Planctomycetota bacterium]